MSSSSLYAMDAELGWNFCPPEILWEVFKNLSSKELLNCMIVSRRWKAIADHYTEFHDLWEKLVSDEMDNLGLSFRRKTVLGWKNMLMNSILWESCSSAKMELIHTYNLNNIRHIHMYRDRLIVIMNSNKIKIEYYNVTNFEMDNVFESSSNALDFIENDSMFVALYQKGVLHMFGKTVPPNDETILSRGETAHSMEKTCLYKLEDKTCYVVDKKFVVWACTWDNNVWDIQLVGRYNGGAKEKASAIHVYYNRVYIATTYGYMLCECPITRKFQKMYNSSIDDYRFPRRWSLFNLFNIAVALTSRLPIASSGRTIDKDHLKIECTGMTCATEHGDVLIVGFKDGKILICMPTKMRKTGVKPNNEMFIQDYDSNIKDPRIIALEVFEDKLSHHLLVATKDHVSQLLLTYPDTITELYE